MLLFIIEPLLRMCMYMYFNTSHVTVYHYPGFFCSALRKFQYISCYCLSPSHWEWPPGVWISIHLMLLFINQDHHTFLQYQDFNTSHVTVYPCSAKTSLPDLYHFNTSHVTVYLLHPPNNPYPLSISIHLMLLFISSTNITVGKLIIFQYISCYCLSKC